MEKKSCAELKQGMVVAKEIIDSEGELLSPPGVVLCDSSIALLRAHAIEFVYVVNEEALLQQISAIEQRVAQRFKNETENPIMQHIAQIACTYLTSKLLSRHNSLSREK